MQHIQMAQAGDLIEILEVLAACVENMRARGIDQWDEAYPTREKLEADLGAGNLYVRRGEGRIAGLVVLDQKQDPEYADVPWEHPAEGAGIVHRLMIAPEFQGRGMAKELMRAVEAEALRRSLGSIRLDAFTLNPWALRLYRGLGYRETGLIRLRKGIFQCFEKGLQGFTGR